MAMGSAWRGHSFYKDSSVSKSSLFACWRSTFTTDGSEGAALSLSFRRGHAPRLRAHELILVLRVSSSRNSATPALHSAVASQFSHAPLSPLTDLSPCARSDLVTASRPDSESTRNSRYQCLCIFACTMRCQHERCPPGVARLAGVRINQPGLTRLSHLSLTDHDSPVSSIATRRTWARTRHPTAVLARSAMTFSTGRRPSWDRTSHRTPAVFTS